MKTDLPQHLVKTLDNADKLIREGHQVFFKFTCAKCGARQTFPEPNAFYEQGICEECKHISDLLKPDANINFALVAALTPDAKEFLKNLKL